jgi:hypothetical protein
MRRRRWATAVLGLAVAAAGGFTEHRHHLAVGVVLVTLGLTVWVWASGSAVIDTVEHDSGTGQEGRE